MRIYTTLHYTNLRGLTTNLSDLRLHEFMQPDSTRIYSTWLYMNLHDLTLREFTIPDIARIYATWHYMNLRDLT